MTELSLSNQNPWWANPNAISTDPHIIKFQECPVQWTPRIRHFFDLQSDGVYTLRGPRQVGKTTLLKLIIKSLLERGVHPRRIFYWSCDLIEGPKELVNHLEGYLDSTRNLMNERLYVLLDEISAVRDWQRGIKHLFDIGKLRNCTVIMTGSHSLDIRRAAERLPGRRGTVAGVADKILVPMKFGEYVETRNEEIKNLLQTLNLIALENRKSILMELAKGNIPQQVQELALHSQVLSTLLDDYLLTGGIIQAISDYLLQGRIRPETFSTYVQVTLGDLTRWHKKEAYLAQLLRRIMETLTTQVSWQTLKRDTDIGHVNTVAEYVDVLQSSFVLCPIYPLDRSKKSPMYEKDKKIHFLDPFIFHALRGWVNQTPAYEEAISFLRNSENKSKLVECLVCDHLIRLAFNLNPTDDFIPSMNVFYWKSEQKEVDYVLDLEREYLPIEVKYQSSISRENLNSIYSFLRTQSTYRGIVVTKDLLSAERGVVMIPVHIFLCLI